MVLRGLTRNLRSRRSSSGRRQTFGFCRDLRGSPVNVAEEIRHVVGDNVDDVRLAPGGGLVHCGTQASAAHSEFQPELGQAADIGDRIIHYFASSGVRGLEAASAALVLAVLFSVRLFRPGKLRPSSQPDRSGCAELGAGTSLSQSACMVPQYGKSDPDRSQQSNPRLG
jgi:hypothetical protein